MKFYKNFQLLGSTLYYTEHDNGQDFFRTKEVKPTLYRKGYGEFKTIHGELLDAVKFDDCTSAREFAKTLGDKCYGFDRFGYAEISQMFGKEYDKTKIKIAYIDIENAVTDKFPDIESADTPINCLTLGFKGNYFCFTTLDPQKQEFKDNYRVTRVSTETELLAKFLQLWKMLRPDICSGWNNAGYDLPYLAKRIEVILGKTEMNSLSPFGKVRIRKEEDEGRENFSCNIVGVSVLDFMLLYKKFRLITRENYKLGFIAEEELGETKLELPGTFYESYTNHPGKFILYNIIDTELVAKLEKKLSMIDLAISVGYTSKTNYEDCLSVVLVWDALIAEHLFAQNIIVPFRKASGAGNGYEGAYVKDPLPGYYEWAVSFDFESLYPRLIQTYNISPETMIAKELWVNLRPTDIVNETELYQSAKNQADKYDAALTGNGGLYSKDKTGFVPFLAEMMFTKRKEAKQEMLKYKRELELVEAEIMKRGLNV
jgi:DNA polymerase elongation subunit (family B)